MPADIAILVRDRAKPRPSGARWRSGGASVYLSDKDSVVDSEEAADVLRWLHAVANPLDGALARAAFATAHRRPAAGANWRAVERRTGVGRARRAAEGPAPVWQRQGVLAMLRRFIHELGLPAALLREAGRRARLTNLLHLAELLQSASGQLDGEQALIRWFAEQVEGLGEGGDERVLRLESDAELVKVVTVHKSKGLEYPLVYLPFAVTARKTDRATAASSSTCMRTAAPHRPGAVGRSAAGGRPGAHRGRPAPAVRGADARAPLPVAGRGGGGGRQEGREHAARIGAGLPADRRRAGAGEAPCASAGTQLRGDCAASSCTRWRARGLHAAGAGRTSARRWWRRAPSAALRAQLVGRFLHLADAPHDRRAPMRAQEETLLEDEDPARSVRTEDAPWHRFPRGSVPGNFLHEQLEWMGQEGFRAIDDDELRRAPGRSASSAPAGATGWTTPSPGCARWRHAPAAAGRALATARTRAARDGVLVPQRAPGPGRARPPVPPAPAGQGTPRPTLPERQLHGMLKGFADLVFEHEGRYWVLDYKSNALGPATPPTARRAMAQGMAAHRYDIQGAIYLLALHRLLKSRLGDDYDPARAAGRRVFLFLRGIANRPRAAAT
jgi:exodeoxyribonuclease V beta subunit